MKLDMTHDTKLFNKGNIKGKVYQQPSGNTCSIC